MSVRTALLALRLAAAPKAAVPQFELANPAPFFRVVKTLAGKLTQQQVDTINGILAACADWPLSWTAYALATAWHEARFIPQREWGRGKGRPYGKPGARMKPRAGLPTYGGQVPYGRGLVQVTWVENYEWLDKAASGAGLMHPEQLLADFDLALRPDIAALALVKGMEEGAFNPKGKGIAFYIPREFAGYEDFVKARILVNLHDKDRLIAGYAVKFREALLAGGWA
ncbi:hypothetical protein [Croceibacterium aestuarii]|uniref:hypothetical protein n=1 Tax=Croceibacterium aestuarii TaxID=3064139 RepID=UPI00272DD3C2|nr:hypothetical protein [Croceibacterium sp. D39]